MPIIKSAKKRVRSSARKYKRNLLKKTTYKTAVKRVSTEKKSEGLRDAYKALDKAAKSRIIHKNKAARLKSRLSKLVKKSA